jgi:hypothetical protein
LDFVFACFQLISEERVGSIVADALERHEASFLVDLLDFHVWWVQSGVIQTVVDTLVVLPSLLDTLVQRINRRRPFALGKWQDLDLMVSSTVIALLDHRTRVVVDLLSADVLWAAQFGAIAIALGWMSDVDHNRWAVGWRARHNLALGTVGIESVGRITYAALSTEALALARILESAADASSDFDRSAVAHAASASLGDDVNDRLGWAFTDDNSSGRLLNIAVRISGVWLDAFEYLVLEDFTTLALFL